MSSVAVRQTPAPTVPAAFWSLSADEALRYGQAVAAAATGAAPHNAAVLRMLAPVRLVLRQLVSPVTLILIVAALLALITGDVVDGSIILAIVAGSAALGAWQENRAADAVAKLTAHVAVTIRIKRESQQLTVTASQVRPGDVVLLSAGNIIPADCLLVDSDDLSVDESALTGESFPVSKTAGDTLPATTPLAKRSNALFAGTHVVSGTGQGLVILTSSRTTFGHLTRSLQQKPQATSFEQGIRKFGLLLVRVMLVLVSMTLVINLVLQRPLLDSLLFALALAVGITPQMLPVVVSVSLAAGARVMARSKVIVKRLVVIEDLGAMSVLCTDKTGTLTLGTVTVKSAVDARGTQSVRVLELAALNAGLQSGYPNPLDIAIVSAHAIPAGLEALSEAPYDFQRKRLSIVTPIDGVATMITKGSVDSVLSCSTAVRTADSTTPIGPLLSGITTMTKKFGIDGFRVIAVATRTLDSGENNIEPASEHDLVFQGLLVFDDPVKPDARASIAALTELSVSVKVVTGDNRFVTASLAETLAFANTRVVVGEELTAANPVELRELVSRNTLFAEVEPLHKALIVTALKACGETVGFLGDGINDAAALHAADVGISVDTGVDVAKEAAAIVLLAQDLAVVATGVQLGRRTFANTLKYVRVASSANFGNILSMVIAAAVLPFLPMLPAQILLLNFLSDIPNTLVSRDHVDPERLRTAGSWNMRTVTRFMILFGATSTLFDLVTFAVLTWGFHADAALFHSGWFVLSAITQFVAMMTLRTSRPAWRSTPERVFFAVSASIALIGLSLPFTPLAAVLGFVALPLSLLAVLLLVAVCYGFANEAMKRWVRF